MTTPTAFVVANGKIDNYSLISSLIPKNQTLVAVDGGLAHCHNMGRKPDLLIGDSDSVSRELLKEYPNLKTIPAPSQDQFDLEKATEWLFASGVQQIKVFGALGLRTDHILANTLLLTRYPQNMIFETENEILFSLKKTITFDVSSKQIISLIPLNGPVEKITTTGLKWNLKDQTLDKNFIGISNICLEKKVSIRVQRGDLVVCLQKS